MTATLWCITVTPILQMRSWDHEGEVCCLQVHRTMQGHQNPNQIWPAYVSRAHVLNHSRDKGRKDGPTSSNHGVNVRATRLSMSFCFFLSLLKPPQNGRNRHADSSIISWVPTMCETWWWAFSFTPWHVNPGNSPMQWGLSLLHEGEGTCRERMSSGGFSGVTNAVCGRARDGTQVYC